MTNIKYFIKDQEIIHRKLVILNGGNEDKLLKILNKGELLKIVMLPQKTEKELLFDYLNVEDVEVLEIK
ncbi:hypothetical protein [Enterococcus caccae]|uniref:Uncharacterized protein n=1 Tax=Enterococcus caccae ATCC BAA-1240 TaxID=1158612 RepID=R3WC55_9ENTE|nr:hypothetical protein [Enterococcus caccae]EOL45042.1 hypothetical protein UC7_01848 [Enterococcus caccae ATCC BAA-1240]EOT58449.1 hypothetical protein I580_02620 [Enterococcus caccae ATCC BAA-1240]OJG24894.1 hypothetical protein RU98_GL001227 [Enterococcus caccae]